MGTADQLIDELADQFMDALLAGDPISATRIGDTRWNDRLPDLGDSGRGAAESAYRSILSNATAVLPGTLGPEQALTREILILTATDLLASLELREYQLGVNHIRGVQSIPTDVSQYHVAIEPDDLQALLGRLAAFPTLIEQHIATLREGIADARTSAIEPVRHTITQIEMLVSQPTRESAVVTVARVADRQARERVQGAVEAHVKPALLAYRDFLADVYLPRARHHPGLGSTPGGDRAYAQAIRWQTSLDRDPDEIHRVGLEEVRNIDVEMDTLAANLGHTDRNTLRRALMSPDAVLQTEGMVPMAEAQVERATNAAPRYFRHIPSTACRVRPVEEYREEVEVGAFYVPPSADGTRDGEFYLNRTNLADLPRHLLAAIAFHEAVPGHHFQLATEIGLAHASRFRALSSSIERPPLNNGYVEGWALYAERLADEMGLYESEEERFGMLEAQLGRAMRLVVDTGIHSLGWSRERAVRALHESDGELYPRALSEQEVDRYSVWPAQALGYKLGQREIELAREDTSRHMGSQFDARTFHDEVLGHGSLPLPILRREIVGWVERATNSGVVRPGATTTSPT
jgi:uncharacterized protein (DUF885 family)